MSFPPARLAAAIVFPFLALAPSAAPLDDAAPSVDGWTQYGDVEQAGFAAAGLDAARRAAIDAGSTAVVVVHGGRVVAAWGAVDERLPVGAIEPAIAGLLFGIARDAGRLDLDATLEQLAIDDEPPLSADERRATVDDVLRMRSGIGLPAPERPWRWNRWDADVLGDLYLAATGRPFATALADDLATPLGLEDFDAARDLALLREPRRARHPARRLRLSARDLARVGQLVADEGRWRGRSIVPASWIAESTRALTTFPPGHERGEGNGFGRLWWTLPRQARAASHFERFTWVVAEGDGGDRLLVAPAIDLVIVHRGGHDGDTTAAARAVTRVVEAIVAARRDAPADTPRLAPLAPRPFDPR